MYMERIEWALCALGQAYARCERVGLTTRACLVFIDGNMILEPPRANRHPQAAPIKLASPLFEPPPHATKMPRSNSDADENDSLTSDDEAVGPTSGPINGNADDVRTAVSYQPDTTGNEVGAEGVESGSSPPERPIDRFRSAANKVLHRFLSRRS